MVSEISKENQAEKREGIETPESFLEKFKNRQDVSLIFLKGGIHGGLNPELKADITTQLGQWFEITEGEEKELAFQEIVARWGGGYLKYPSLEVMRENPNFTQDFLKEGEICLNNKNEDGFREWLEQAKNIAGDDIGLLRMEMLMAYYASGGQNILLKLKEGITRERIFHDLGLDDLETLEEAVGSEKVNIEWLDSRKVSFQEFVKRFVVGDTTADKALPGTIRSIVGKKMKERRLIPCANLWGDPNDQWAFKKNFHDSKLVASNLLNAVHAAGSLEELELEVNLLGQSDVEKFSETLSS